MFEEDGRLYLFYSIAGEMGIAMAEITIKNGVEQSPASDVLKAAPEE